LPAQPLRGGESPSGRLLHFRIFCLGLNRLSLLVRTQGSTDLDLVRAIRFNDPVHPMQEVPDRRPADRRRRGV